MLDLNRIITENRKLIERFVDLSLCEDTIYDTRHRWFYSLISKDKLEQIVPYLSKEDIRSEIHLYLIEAASKYKNSYFEFTQYIKKSIAWHIKDHLLSIHRIYKWDTVFYKQLATEITLEELPSINVNLNWILTDNTISLTIYEKYLLYLYTNKCYTIDQIQSIVYQEKTTLRKQLNSIKNIVRNFYAHKE